MSTTSASFAFATLAMMREAMNAATPATSGANTEPFSEDKLRLLYLLKVSNVKPSNGFQTPEPQGITS
ncbi:hypothetical protein [Glutamicibacter ardleyensis]|uniref:hypothetical protein n=1 Tax=Glutamicibacter ardleyensis TaxID=225894 RepID=UPI003FD27A6F